MLSALIITLRETLEAALIVGIILAYLNKTDNRGHSKIVWFGVLAGIILSLVLAFIFQTFFGGFEGAAEELYEGITMIIAATLLTWMILWLIFQRHNLKKNIENKMQTYIEKDHPVGLFLLSFVSVAREGIETVIFLQAAAIQTQDTNLIIGGSLGIIIAIILSYFLYKGIKIIPLKKFFTVTSILLILFAAGLFVHGIHELQEAGVVPTIIEHVWDINPLLNEKSTIGGLLKGLFGYNGNPSLLEVINYIAYLLGISFVWNRIEKKRKEN